MSSLVAKKAKSRPGRRKPKALPADVAIVREALGESEARFWSLLNNASCGIYGVALDGTILHANLAVARMLGYESREELLAVGKSASFYSNPRVREELLARYRRDGRADSTVLWRRKDGKIITVRITSWRAKDPLDGREYVEVIAEDVTGQLTLEKQFILAQKFEPLGQLAGGIAHDFGNMIGAIIGWADLGVEESEPGSRARRHFDKVRQQADRAAALSRHLLAFARRQILEPCEMDLNQTVIETLSLLEKVIGTNIRIAANLSPNLAVVRADQVQVEQVILNLCLNARDAMPKGGSLTVETSNVTFDGTSCDVQPWAHPGQYAMLSVADTGTGIASSILDHVFEPFFTTKETGKGTGLGLATVEGIVRQHGGFVRVDSEPGVGSTFRVYFPLIPAKSIRQPPDERPCLGTQE